MRFLECCDHGENIQKIVLDSETRKVIDHRATGIREQKEEKNTSCSWSEFEIAVYGKKESVLAASASNIFFPLQSQSPIPFSVRLLAFFILHQFRVSLLTSLTICDTRFFSSNSLVNVFVC